jgi:hypothetical protein
MRPIMKLDPSVSWGDIAMGVGLLFTGVVAFTDVSERVALNETETRHVSATVQVVDRKLAIHAEQEERLREASRSEIRQELRDINGKLDKLIERELDRPGRQR